jgi:hypothetical protein
MTTATKNHLWQPGQSGNPSGLPGRPLGSRQAFSAGFIHDLAQVWQSHGKETMIKTATEQPSVFFATCARLIPADVRVTVQAALPGNLNHEDWSMLMDILAAVKAAMPDARDREPGQVLEHVRAALEAYGK